MKRNISVILLIAGIWLISFSGLICISGGFSTNSQFTDASDDATSAYEDLQDIWIDNNKTHIMCKISLGGPWNASLSGQVIYFSVSTSDSIGSDPGWFGGWNCDYFFGVSATGTIINNVFYDMDNSSNSLSTNNNLGYFISTNNGQTMEIGYKLGTYQDNKGYINHEVGDVIEVRLYSGGDSDVAPENAANPISYTIKANEQEIAGFDTLIISTSILFVIGFILTRKFKSRK